MRHLYQALLLINFFCYLHTAQVLKRASVYYKEDRVQNTRFGYRLDAIDGIVKETWYVDDKPMNQNEFEILRDTAEQEERRDKRAKKREHRLRLEKLRTRALTMKAQDKLAKIIKFLEKILSNITHYDVELYYAFAPTTIPSKVALTKLRYELIPIAQALSDSQEALLKDVQENINQLNDYPERLSEFFYATIDKALATCSDTKLLKKLLDLVPDAESIK